MYNWQKVLERPVYEGVDEEFNLSNDSWDLITRLICTKDDRLQDPKDLKDHPFFKSIEFDNFRVPGCFRVPLVPVLNSTTDTTYFDDFTDPKDMALYGDIKRKEMDNKNSKDNIKVMQSAFAGFTFKHQKARIE